MPTPDQRTIHDAATNMLSHYQTIAGASQRMLTAARDADWDTVTALEAHCTTLIDQLKRTAATPLSSIDEQRKAVIIRGLLADDAEIRNLAQPRLAELQSLIESNSNQRRLGRFYEP